MFLLITVSFGNHAQKCKLLLIFVFIIKQVICFACTVIEDKSYINPDNIKTKRISLSSGNKRLMWQLNDFIYLDHSYSHFESISFR